MEWSNPPQSVIDRQTQRRASNYGEMITVMERNKGRWALVAKAVKSRTTVYYLRSRYPQLTVVCLQNEDKGWDVYAMHREDA